jgi:hypothetical protein
MMLTVPLTAQASASATGETETSMSEASVENMVIGQVSTPMPPTPPTIKRTIPEEALS